MMITRRLASFAGPLLVAGTSHGQPCEPIWSDQFRPQGLDDTVWSMAVFDDGSGPSLYVAGLFQKAGDAALNHIARLDGNVWSSPGSGTDDYVMALAACDECPDGAPSLYAGGLFRHAGGLAVNSIARWDGKSWSALGGSKEGYFVIVNVLSILDDGTGPALFAAGTLATTGGEMIQAIARWDGSAWTVLGGGASGSIFSIALFDDGSGPTVYAGGTFSEDGVIVGRVARWDGTSWTLVPAGPNGKVSELVAWDDGSGSALYAGGTFTSAGGQPAANLARWDGATWSALPAQLNGGVSALIIFDDGSAGPALYATGVFTLAGGLTANRIARWDGAAWTPLAEGLTSRGHAMAATDTGDGGPPRLFVGGEFSFAGQVTTARVAWWDGLTWSGVTPPGVWGYYDVVVNDLEPYDDGSGPALFAAGDFNGAGAVISRDVARFDGRQWSSLAGGMDGGFRTKVNALEAFDYGDGPALYAGGRFETAGGIQAQNIARWDGETWAPLGPGVGGTVNDMVGFNDGTGPALYVGGFLASAGEVLVNHVARWNGSTWSSLGDGTVGAVQALAVFDDGHGPALHAAGKHYPDNENTIFLSRWDGKSWSTVGGVGEAPSPGEYDTIYDLAVYDDGNGPALYVAGSFGTLGGFPAGGVARWDGSRWLSAGGGVGAGGAVHALRVARLGSDTTPALYAAGGFTFAGGAAAASIARWNGAFWSPLGAGIGGYGSAMALAAYDDGSDRGASLFVGGGFETAGGIASPAIAQWVGCPVDDPPRFRPCRYDATLIDSPPDPPWDFSVYAVGMNSAGDVVGWWGGVSFPFMWTPQDGFVTLEGMPYAFGSASDINGARRIVGTSFTYTDSIAFAYQDGNVTLLPPMFGGGSSARAINDAGQVAGSRSIWIDDEPYNAFVWSPEDGFTDLGVMNGPNSTCTDINDLGDAVGWTGSYFTPTEAFLWHDGRLTLLGPVPGGTSSSASAINNVGQIAITGGVQQGDSTVYRAFLWRAGEWMEMGILPGFEHCSVYDVNDSGVAVGRCWNTYPNNLTEIFVWQDGVMTPMDDLLPWDVGVRMSEVATINSAGQIAGTGSAGYETGAVVLTPVARRPADINGDCGVDGADLLILLFEWGEAGSPADLDGDGSVGILDFLILLATWT